MTDAPQPVQMPIVDQATYLDEGRKVTYADGPTDTEELRRELERLNGNQPPRD